MPRWPKWITAQYLRQMTRCLRIGDIVYLPRTTLDITEMHPVIDELWKSGILPKALPENQRELAKDIPQSFVWQILRDAYFDHCAAHSVRDKSDWRIKRVLEPNWVKQVPDILKGDIRALAEIHGLQEDFFISIWWPLHPCVPYTSVSYVMREKGLTESIVNGIGLFRQHGNKQLGYLHNTAVSKEGGYIILRFNTTRFVHSMDVTSIFNLIAFNNRDSLSYYLRKNGRASATTHDSMMVGGGESVKLADPNELCEERNIIRMFQKKGWRQEEKKRGLSRRIISDSVRGKGVTGHLLDIADKIYVARDMADYFYTHDLLGLYGQAEGYFILKEFASRNPLVCDYWDCVKVSPEGAVYFADPAKLIEILTLRVLLFRELYFHPGARYLEFLISNIVIKHMLDTGAVKRDDLIEWMTDFDTDALINKFLGRPFGIDSVSFLGNTHVEVFTTPEEAYQREAELFQKGICLAFVDVVGKIKTCADFSVEIGAGNIKPLFKALPEVAKKIECLAVIENPVRLYYLTDSQIGKEAQKAIQAYQKRDLERRNHEKK